MVAPGARQEVRSLEGAKEKRRICVCMVDAADKSAELGVQKRKERKRRGTRLGESYDERDGVGCMA